MCFFGSPSQEALQAERLFIGFWTDKGRCNQEITDFLKTLKCKEVFLFGTAGFGGSQEYFDKILSSVQKRLGASNTVIGTYMCQGKMPQSVRERYVKMKNSPLPIPNVDKMIENFDISDKNGNRIFFMSLSKIVLGDENQVLILLSDVTDEGIFIYFKL